MFTPGHKRGHSGVNSPISALRLRRPTREYQGVVGGVPSGIRTRVLALKGPRPGPLDDGDSREECDDSGQDRNM